MTETELLDYNDTIVDFVSLINHYGTKRVLMDLQVAYPAFFDELRTQVNRFPSKPVAALLRK